MFASGIWIVIGVVVFLVIALIGVFVSKYRTAGPDEALIVTGSFLGGKNVHVDEAGNKIKIIRGGGTFVFPVFQQAKPLSLLSSKLEVTTPEVYTEQGVPVMADGIAIIKIGGSIGEIATAAEQFLGKSKEDRENEAREVLEGHLRSILGSMTVEEIYKNRDKFSQEVQRVASQDLAKMGLIIVSFTIKEVKDKNGYLDALGKPRIAQVKRDADIATAEAEKETRIRKAEALKEAKRAELERATEIAEAEKFNQLKIAEFRREQDIARAKADQAYDLETARSKQDVTAQEMEIKIIERQKQIELEEKEILRRERQYDSEVKKKRMQTVIRLSRPPLQKKRNKWQKPTPTNTGWKRWRKRKGNASALMVRLKPMPSAPKGNRKPKSSVSKGWPKRKQNEKLRKHTNSSARRLCSI